MRTVNILGLGHYVPSNIVTNDDLSKVVDTSDEWIFSRTGIKERRISKYENTTDLAVEAARLAIKDCNICPKSIDLIVVGTVTPDYFVPSTACLVQERLGAVNATCFDINAACSGYIYGINVASQFLKTNQSKIALVIGVDIMSKVLNWNDRSTCVLFGDGASAVVLGIGNYGGIISMYTGSDGSKGNSLFIPGIPLKNVIVSFNQSVANEINMQGSDVFKFATNAIITSINTILNNSSTSLSEIKYIICHQANYRIIEYVAKKLNINIDKFYINLQKYGNTSAASIGIAFDEVYITGQLSKGDKVILVGFGGGFTWGSILVQWTKEKIM
ncbi:beta-ketoacyl-ACP synthase III [Clostridium sp. DJ247]|uniref:beta-ketoacyl-ACP synthase III n=1 Tax=Clostridium sp. DJ247 TaxID=2726188 RepID=UPI001624A7E0|nr:beta-ketoacyl-ACP synthase III [Clostridium sp. DJ247]MBC2580739.1 ketoacyl-ACP synthase III [Clostridium sp. DJ247]